MKLLNGESVSPVRAYNYGKDVKVHDAELVNQTIAEYQARIDELEGELSGAYVVGKQSTDANGEIIRYRKSGDLSGETNVVTG